MISARLPRVKVEIIGGGPGGLYLAILLRKQGRHEVAVHERNAADDTFGWGVVFSEATLDNLEEADAESYRAVTETFAKWDAVDVHFKGEVIRSGGHGFCGIERKRLLNLLQDRAAELGVDIRYKTEVKELPEADLVVAADGVNSLLRTGYAADFKPTISLGKAKFVWFGTTRPFEAFTFFSRENEHGFFQVHAYQYDKEKSTFIVECDEETFKASGLGTGGERGTVDYLEALFKEELQGHPLLTNKSEWINFRTVRNERWHKGNLVLLGDAARTAHFSIGSGTKLAMEDAICLARCLAEEKRPLEAYEAERKWFSEKLQQMAEESRRWFETVRLRRHLEPEQFAYSMMTRNKRLGHDQLRVRDEGYIDRVETWFSAKSSVPPRPPMFTPFSLRSLKLGNRIVCSPMCMYSAEDGTVGDWQLVHLGARAVGGAGLVIAEMTDVSRDGRISPGCAGMWRPEHVPAWRRVTEFVHKWTPGKIGLQLGHAGRKGATRLMWDGHDQPLDEGAWPILSASAVPYHKWSQVPKAMDKADMDRVKADYVRAAGMAVEAGFDMLEIHMAHSYLLASFLSPLTNRRTDEYGGGIGGRMRYPLEVFRAVREAWPEDKPISVRISAIDWKEGGQAIEDSIEFARALKGAGCDIVDVSTGHTDDDESPELARCYQVPFAERIRFGAGIPTIAVGAISRHGEINAILASGSADLVALARPHLFDPHFTLRAAAEQGFYDQPWPKQYGPAKPPPREKLPWLERERRKRRP